MSLLLDELAKTHRGNLICCDHFLSRCGLREQDIIKFEIRRGEVPTVHVVNHAFLQLAPDSMTVEEQIGCGGNVHKSVLVLGVRLVSVFRRENQ